MALVNKQSMKQVAILALGTGIGMIIAPFIGSLVASVRARLKM